MVGGIFLCDKFILQRPLQGEPNSRRWLLPPAVVERKLKSDPLAPGLARPTCRWTQIAEPGKSCPAIVEHKSKSDPFAPGLARWPPGATWLSRRLASFQWFCLFRSLRKEREAWTLFSGMIWQEPYKLLILFNENYNMAPDNVTRPLNTDPIFYF